MKSTKRALRRHHRERMIARVLKSYALRAIDGKELQRARALRRYNNSQPCSCYMCGNPRKFENERPFQEERLHEAARYEVIEFLAKESDFDEGPIMTEFNS